MSENLAVSARLDPAGAPKAAPDRRRRSLKVVTPAPARLGRAPFAALVSVLLTGGLLTLLLLNTVLAQNSIKMYDVTEHLATLADQEQWLEQDLARTESPDQLAERARALGMVPGGSPAFIRVSDGAVLGDPAPVLAAVTPKPTASSNPATKPSTNATVKPTTKTTGKKPTIKKPIVKPTAKATTKPVTKPAAGSGTGTR